MDFLMNILEQKSSFTVSIAESMYKVLRAPYGVWSSDDPSLSD